MKCLFRKKIKTPRGGKVRCGFDGSIRNECKETCPHYSPKKLFRIRR